MKRELNADKIVKAFECCIDGRCKDCSYYLGNCRCKMKQLIKDAVALIGVLRTENEHLKALTEDGKLLEQLAIYKTKVIDYEKEKNDGKNQHNAQHRFEDSGNETRNTLG